MICGCGTDLWLTFMKVCFSNNNGKDVETTYQDLADLLNIEVTKVERKAHERARKKRKRDYSRLNCEEGKLRTRQAKLSLAHRTGKDINKSRHRKSEKVKVTRKPKSPSHCRNCGHIGHTNRICVVPPAVKKANVKFFQWNGTIRSEEKHAPRLKRYQPILFDLPKSELVKG